MQNQDGKIRVEKQIKKLGQQAKQMKEKHIRIQ